MQFWTRHNDYKLRMPSRTMHPGDEAYPGKSWHATEDIPLPGVPPAVTAFGPGDVAGQVEEMRAWFKAWQDQDYSVRDYRPYFRPVLSVLEGTWTEDKADIDDPFVSDRHTIDAETWRELHDKTRFLFNSGRKNNLENLPFLPSALREMRDNDTTPVVGNWEYRIICHPLDGDLALDRLRVVEDMHIQLNSNTPKSWATLAKESRNVRFQLNPRRPGNPHGEQGVAWSPDTKSSFEVMDELMGQVPGKDNYRANISDDLILEDNSGKGEEVLDYFGKPLNTGYYNRYYSLSSLDAMGRSKRRRGFNDDAMWAAMTTQSKVQGLTLEGTEQKWSYAVPLEIIWTTPLTSWNPLELVDRGSDTKSAEYKKIRAGGRNGDVSNPDKAYDGVSAHKYFYTIPESLFTGEHQADVDPADTASKTKGVLDAVNRSHVHRVKGGGHWIILPDIAGVGPVRLRYPVMPVHEEGSTSFKETKALARILQARGGNDALLSGIADEQLGVEFELTFVGGHTHTMFMDGADVADLKSGKVGTVTLASSMDNAHDHDVIIKYDSAQTFPFAIVSMTNAEGHSLVRR